MVQKHKKTLKIESFSHFLPVLTQDRTLLGRIPFAAYDGLSLVLLSVDQHLTSVVEFSLMPVGTVVQMSLTCCWILRNLRNCCLVVRSSLVSALL